MGGTQKGLNSGGNKSLSLRLFLQKHSGLLFSAAGVVSAQDTVILPSDTVVVPSDTVVIPPEQETVVREYVHRKP